MILLATLHVGSRRNFNKGFRNVVISVLNLDTHVPDERMCDYFRTNEHRIHYHCYNISVFIQLIMYIMFYTLFCNY